MDIMDIGAATSSPAPHVECEGEDLRSRTEHVAAVARDHVSDVDRDAAFPSDAIAAAKRAGFMGLLVPRALGGEGARLSEVAEVCFTLGQACGSTGMIIAMHQAALACITRHCDASPWHRALSQRVAREKLLLASSTTEGRSGGNVRSSAASIEAVGTQIRLDRDATVMSYGAEADVIVTTARRTPDAAPSDQVLVAFYRADYTLERVGDWDTLGMRGTRSAGFALHAIGTREQILPTPYDAIHAQSMVPVSHILWASVWAGIAASAVARAQRFVRTAARRAGGQMPPGAPHYTKAVGSLRLLRALIGANLQTIERSDASVLSAIDMQAGLNLLKIDASELAMATVMSALRASGLSGYRNNGEFGLGRHMRDILSSPIMVHNDRIASNIATATLMSGVPNSLFD